LDAAPVSATRSRQIRELAVDETSNLLLAWIFGVCLFLIIGIPTAIWAVRRVAHNKRRRLERSKRQIKVNPLTQTAEQKACPHRRSKSRAKAGEDGRLRSICRFCGVPMLRLAQGEWEVLESEANPPAA
jgi:hypothetical protein